MTIIGADLTGTSKVTMGGIPVDALTVVDDATVTVKSPKQVPFVPYAVVDLVLTAPGGTVTLPRAIVFNPPPGTGVTAKGSDWAVHVEAAVTANSPTITLKWPLETRATGYAIARKRRAEHTWTPMGVAPGNATPWSDTNVTVGQVYEYQVQRTSTILAYPATSGNHLLVPLISHGYVYAGITVPAVDNRGSVLLIVDNILAAGPCSGELTLRHQYLVGDGWSVIRHDVARGVMTNTKRPSSYDTAGVQAVKSLIVNDYQQHPGEGKSVYLFGHVPVPYAAISSPPAMRMGIAAPSPPTSTTLTWSAFGWIPR